MIEWRSEALRADHDVSSFDCSVDSLNEWLRSHALRAQQQDTARTYVWVPADGNDVVAYYSISATQVLRSDLSGSQAGGYSTVPAYLLARLALHRTLHGQQLGSELLLDALETMVRAADSAAARLIMVDAIDEAAAAFYRHHDFVPIKDNALRLVMKVASARKALGVTSVRITADTRLGLVSLVWKRPDGRTVPVVASPAEARSIAERLIAEADQRETEPDARIDFQAILREVLGRDP